MYLLGLDVETTGLDSDKDRIIEIGAVLWDWELGQPVQLLSELILEVPNLALDSQIEDLTGITTALLNRFGKEPDDALFARMAEMLAAADYLVAHNASFDRGFLSAFYQRWGRQFPETPWICTYQDVDYPASIRGKNLIYLAGAHGFANPFSHRAVTDVLSMFKVLSHYDLNSCIENALSPKLELVALVSYDNRNLAKEQGFRWDGDSKKWKKKVRKNRFEPGKLPFEVEVIELD
ncbi:MAG: exonuclease domain-containing protein [bacterium]|nr:exonuclease domain-containing protein [bacterium]